MAPRSGIVWSPHPNVIRARITALGPLLEHALDRRLAARALEREGAAKVRAPWTDRTGAARAGLHGTSHVGGGRAEIALAYSVDYGIWLEVANEGRFATIIPTMQEAVGLVRGDLQGLLGSAG